MPGPMNQPTAIRRPLAYMYYVLVPLLLAAPTRARELLDAPPVQPVEVVRLVAARRKVAWARGAQRLARRTAADYAGRALRATPSG